MRLVTPGERDPLLLSAGELQRNMFHGTCCMQHAACNMFHATCNTSPVACNTRHEDRTTKQACMCTRMHTRARTHACQPSTCDPPSPTRTFAMLRSRPTAASAAATASALAAAHPYATDCSTCAPSHVGHSRVVSCHRCAWLCTLAHGHPAGPAGGCIASKERIPTAAAGRVRWCRRSMRQGSAWASCACVRSQAKRRVALSHRKGTAPGPRLPCAHAATQGRAADNQHLRARDGPVLSRRPLCEASGPRRRVLQPEPRRTIERYTAADGVVVPLQQSHQRGLAHATCANLSEHHSHWDAQPRP